MQTSLLQLQPSPVHRHVPAKRLISSKHMINKCGRKFSHAESVGQKTDII